MLLRHVIKIKIMAEPNIVLTFDHFYSRQPVDKIERCCACDDEIYQYGFLCSYFIKEIELFGDHNLWLCESCADGTTADIL